jgi:site-specific DNA-cytosine methylase
MGEGMVMSMQNERDPRTILVREKYFSLRPKPLERWLWQQGLPQAAERVFWLHWEEGMKRGDWCSELALRQVARECCVDASTVTRAYQLLKSLDLIRRQDPGRDPANPFQQAIAVTEVRVPRALLNELGRAPSRGLKHAQAPQGASPKAQREEGSPVNGKNVEAAPSASQAIPTSSKALTRVESAALMRKLSERERTAFFVASRDRLTDMAFDADTVLSPEDQRSVIELLTRISSASPAVAVAPSASASRSPAQFAKERRLSPLEAARVRKYVLALVPATAGAEVFRQVLWSVEEGALRRFEPRLAINIALKKIREGAWSRPNRMPPNWLRPAVPEACSAA